MQTKPRTNINALRMWQIRHLPVRPSLMLNFIVKRVCQKLQWRHRDVAPSYTALPRFLCSQTFEIQPQRWTARNRISLSPEDSSICSTETAPKFWPTALRENLYLVEGDAYQHSLSSHRRTIRNVCKSKRISHIGLVIWGVFNVVLERSLPHPNIC